MDTTLVHRRTGSWPLLAPGVAALLVVAALTAAACGEDARVDQAPGMRSDSAVRATRSADYTSPVDPERLVGLEFPPWPPGIESLATSLLVKPFKPVPDTVWSLTHVRVGGRPMVFLSRVVSRRTELIMQDGKRVGSRVTLTFRVEDAVVLPRTDVDERVELYDCRTPDSLNVAAIGRWSDRLKTIDQVRWARGFDPATGRLAEVSLFLVRCRNPAIGGR